MINPTYRTYPKGGLVTLETNPIGTLNGLAEFEPRTLRRESGQNPIHRRTWLSRSFDSRQRQQQLQLQHQASSLLLALTD